MFPHAPCDVVFPMCTLYRRRQLIIEQHTFAAPFPDPAMITYEHSAPLLLSASWWLWRAFFTILTRTPKILTLNARILLRG